MDIAIYGSRRQEPYLDQIKDFLDRLAERGDRAVMHTKLYQYLLHIMPRQLACVTRVTDTPDFKAEFAVSIGGDGSFLRTAAWVADKGIPIIGVNTGHLGFLASLNVERLPELPDLLQGGDFGICHHSLIEVVEPAVACWPFALNEVTVAKTETSSIICVDAHIGDEQIANYRADGLIISTPTGSTAYNLSVGGPIVAPEAPVFILSPIAAHSLSMRPLVLADTNVLTLNCDSRKDFYRLSLDGHSEVFPLDARIVLRKAHFSIKSVELPGHNFAQTLKNKLSWG